ARGGQLGGGDKGCRQGRGAHKDLGTEDEFGPGNREREVTGADGRGVRADEGGSRIHERDAGRGGLRRVGGTGGGDGHDVGIGQRGRCRVVAAGVDHAQRGGATCCAVNRPADRGVGGELKGAARANVGARGRNGEGCGRGIVRRIPAPTVIASAARTCGGTAKAPQRGQQGQCDGCASHT